jgi:DNA-binding MarR family transcriptional regulator
VPRARSSLLFDLFAASQQVRTLLAEQMRGSPLAPDEYAVYSGVFEFAPIMPTELARTVGMPPTTLSHYLRDMRARRHLDEARNPRDGRSQLLTLSAEGLAAHREANRHFTKAYERFVAGIDDRAAVKRALATVEKAAAEARRPVR